MTHKSFDRSSPPAFCIIAPTAYLDVYASVLRTHLVLAHLVATNPKYTEFYNRMSMDGDGIIMDNGAFELGKSYEPDQLLKLGEQCAADVIVLPDYPAQSSQVTIDAAEKYAQEIKDAGFKTMFVPHSKVGDMEDFINGYMWAADNELVDLIGMSILNIPNAMPHIPAAYARVVMTELLMDRGIFAEKYHHYLGLNAGPALEIPSLLEMNALNSCDSSGPVWAALLGHEYSVNADSYLATKKVKAHVDFNYPWVKDLATHKRIEHNIKLTMDLFKQEEKEDEHSDQGPMAPA